MNTPPTPRATLIVLAYNQQDFIREAIEAAFAQTCDGLEILLSDDASTDATFTIMTEMAANYSGGHSVRCRRTTKNAGFISHLRAAVGEANADIVILAAGDDASFPSRAECTLSAFEREPATMAVLSDVAVIGDEPAEGDTGASYLEVTALDMVVGAGGVGKGAAYAYRKGCFGWPTPLLDRYRSEDRVLPLRAALLGRVFRHTKPLVNYRLSAGSMSNTLVKQREQAHQSRDHWQMTLATVKVARRESRISMANYATLRVVLQLAMWSRLLAARSGGSTLSALAYVILLPLRVVQRLQHRISFT